MSVGQITRPSRSSPLRKGVFAPFGLPKPLPLGEVAPKVTERARTARKSRCAAMGRLFVRAIRSQCRAVCQHPCPLSRACARQLPQRGSLWQAGQLSAGRLRPDRAQKGGPCYRGQRLLDKRTLSSCRESWQRSTTIPEKIRLCSSRVGLTGTPVAPPLGELSPKVTERAGL